MYEKLAAEILEKVGGPSNIQSLTHCVTRLRFILKDSAALQLDALKAVDGVAGVVQSCGQIQVIIGTNVTEVYDAVCAAAGLVEHSGNPQKEQLHQTPLQHFIGIMTEVFAPFLGVIAACGIVKGVLPLLAAAGILSADGSTYTILYALADGFFYYMPILLAYTASQRFGLPVVEGLILGAGLLYPSLLSSSALPHQSLLGIPVIMPPSGDYTSTAVPIIVAIAFAAWFEKKYSKYIPAMVKTFVVPLITCTVTFALTIWVIGPAATAVTDALSFVLRWLEGLNGLVYSGVLGVIWQLVLMMGLHYAVLPIVVGNLAVQGFDTTLSSTFGCNFAQIGAVLAIRFRTKDRELQKNCFPALFPAAIGVIEPALYGVTLRDRRVFIITCLVSGITGVGMTMFGAKAYRFAGFGIFGYAAYANQQANDPSGAIVAIVWSLLAVLLSFVLVYFTYGKEKKAA